MSVIGPTGPAGAAYTPVGKVETPVGPTGTAEVIVLAERASEVIEITEVTPYDGTFIGKRINPDRSITPYPEQITWWRQSVAQVPATISHLFAYFRDARKRNICLIRGAPANLARQRTRKWKAEIDGRGDHGFLDVPTRLFCLDGDDIKINWRNDPEGAIREILAQLGEPWASTSCVWFFSASHGLELDAHKCWTGRISDGSVRVRLEFITDTALNQDEAKALTLIAKARVPEIDPRICLTVQANYIQRPHWVEHPDRDVLGDIPTIGVIRGTRDTLTVPDDLAHTARWAKAQGHHTNIADHPDAESAVRSIGNDNDVRPHVMAAVRHLWRTNPVPKGMSFDDHKLNIIAKLRSMITQHREEISTNLVRNGRGEHVVDGLLQHTNPRWLQWLFERPKELTRKTIRLGKEERTEKAIATRKEGIERVARSIKRAASQALNFNSDQAWDNWLSGGRGTAVTPPVKLLVAPPGSGKSTLTRAVIGYVSQRTGKTVVFMVPRHKLGDEQIRLLRDEHPNADFKAAVWRGRHADNPETPDPKHPGKFLEKMCRRPEDAKAIEAAQLDVEHTLCKRGRGKNAVKCPFYVGCAFQGQKRIKANIWFAAHECAVHEMPKAFGKVGWVIFDENPLDAFLFGVDINDQVTLELDTLRAPLAIEWPKFRNQYLDLMKARAELYQVLHNLHLPTNIHHGAAAWLKNLKPFIDTPRRRANHKPKTMRSLTWRGKVKPDIWPNMMKEELKTKLQEAAINTTIKKEVTLWKLLEAVKDEEALSDELFALLYNDEITLDELFNALNYGRIQVHRGEEGRLIRMVGLNELAKGWNVPTFICDATGDAELLKPIWPQLTEAEPRGWEQLPRPPNVRVIQCVDRALSKLMLAIESKDPEKLEPKRAAARRLYAAVLMKALEYGGQDVGVILYKSTRDWIEQNYFVPPWLKLAHWGDVTGTNKMWKVRALFVVGRPLASAEAVTRQVEALFGVHIPERDYVQRRQGGRIPIIPQADGNNCVWVDVWEHLHPMGERLRRQITEGGILQAVERARGGLRTEDEPLDIHLWTDVPVPELGSVEPVLWSELEAGADWLMLATKGVWLKNIADAVRAFEGLFSADGLKTARRRGAFLQGKVGCLPVIRVFYQRAEGGCKPTEAVCLKEITDPRVWLEERLGPLTYFEVVEDAGAGVVSN